MADNFVSIDMSKTRIAIARMPVNVVLNVSAVFQSFTDELMQKLYIRSPVDTGTYRDSWENKGIFITGTEISARITNNAEYASVMETGSEIGQPPWPSVGPKTVESGGAIWSSQQPEPVAGNALAQAELDKLSEDLLNVILKDV